MTTLQNFKDIFSSINDEINRIQIKLGAGPAPQGGMTDSETALALSYCQAVLDKLKTL